MFAEYTKEILIAIGFPSAAFTFGIWFLKNMLLKIEKRREKTEEIREKGQYLIIQSIRTNISLGEATAMALKNGKSNGETEQALAEAQKIKKELNEFLTLAGVKRIY